MRGSKWTLVAVNVSVTFSTTDIDPRLPQDKEKLYFTGVLSGKKKREEGRGEGRRKAVKRRVGKDVKTSTSSGDVNGRQ